MRKKTSRPSAPPEKRNVPTGSGVKTDVLTETDGSTAKRPAKVTSPSGELNNSDDQRQLLRVLTEVRNGNFSVRMPYDEIGLNGKIYDIVNEIVELNERMILEFTKAGQIIGKQGKLNQRIEVANARGSWCHGVESLNALISDLVHPTIEIARVISSVAKGNLSHSMPQKIGGHALQGEFAQIAEEVNDMVKQLNLFSMEVTRVAREVGSEGKLGGQATVKGVGGVWKDLTDSVNQMGSNLTAQVRNIAEVTTAVAKGDLSKKITVDVKGEILELKNTINTMVDQLNSFSSEVTRVALEVGTEGKLGGQATVKGVAGTWKDLTDSVNQMASNLTGQVRNIAEVTTAVAKGDLSKKITVDVKGEILELKNTINTMVDQLNSFSSEVTRVAREVGSEGQLGGQASVPGVAGTWKDLTDSVNKMAGNLTSQVRNIAEVTTAVANGDLSRKITVDVKGEILELKNTINTMVDQLRGFASEVTRVAREVGTDGKLGGQAGVPGVAGTWKDLTDSVNQMAGNITGQVRGIAKVVTSVASGDLRQKLSINAKGEVAQLTETINEMIDTLAVFADQVTTVAREVGVEGRLGGQANVPGTSGIWKNLTENVNQLAQNLTTQVRSIAEVASAVTKGDLTRTIRVEAKGEVESLKDTINQMIANLRATTLRNQETDWLKSNLAKFTQMLQGQKDLDAVTTRILSELAQVVNAHHGAFYILRQEDKNTPAKLALYAGYAYKGKKDIVREFAIGEGLVGQCAVEKERILLSNVAANYISITSGLGKAAPSNLVILPVLFESNVKAVIELASLDVFSQTHLDFLDQVTESIGIVLNTIEANTRTESLLIQSQSLASELKIQQEELRRTNDELQDKALLLVTQKEEVEEKNKEVEEARRSLEEKAEQLQLTSKYKSEFLANMSHELRTPLNSLLILAQQLFENAEGNLSEKQVRYAKTIHSCGDDLIQLINDILDLSKIESGFISTNIAPVNLSEIASFAETTFRPISEARNLRFSINASSELPAAIETDIQRLNQILKNLLSNAFKFTEKGGVSLHIFEAKEGWRSNPNLDVAKMVVGFSISDTGIGIPVEKQMIIFEAFQQAEGSTSRKYGGTGLGLSISRGLADLLGGAIELESTPGRGSTFTLYIPIDSLATSPPFPHNSMRVFGQFQEQEDEIANLLTNLHITKDGTDGRNMEMVSELINETGDDRNNIQPSDQVLLIVEDDFYFSRIIIDKAHAKGLKAIVATNYLEVFDFISRYSPIAITLDIKLPDTSGWKVVDLLRNDLNYRHIPIYVISGEENRILALKRGARNFMLKPVNNEAVDQLFSDINNFRSKNVQDVLVVEHNEQDASQIARMLTDNYIRVEVVSSGKEAFSKMEERNFDCIVVDYSLPDIAGEELLQKISKDKAPLTPVIVYSARDFSRKELSRIYQTSHAVLPKGVNSIEHLLEEVVTQLHIPHMNLATNKRQIIETIRSKEDILTGRNVLIVDDDIRNLFALTTVFERFNINVITAESGQEAIQILNDNPVIEMVLMDIMMPEMDGYETTQRIRREHKNVSLPIIAVTAKAMKGDRQKCIEAGASDYITKPVKIDQLLSLMRLWFFK